MKKFIVCPNSNCRSILAIEDIPGIENKLITCPKCAQVHHFTEYKPYQGKKSIQKEMPSSSNPSDETQPFGGFNSPNMGKNSPNGMKSADETIPFGQTHSVNTTFSTNCLTSIGSIRLQGSSQTFSLSMGENIIGRQAASSTAQIQIPDLKGERSMSRQHLVIKVLQFETGFQHVLYLFPDGKPKNKTMVKDQELQTTTKLILSVGDTITIGHQVLVFEGSEETIIH